MLLADQAGAMQAPVHVLGQAAFASQPRRGHVFRFGIGSGRQHILTPNSYKKIKTGGR